MISDFINSKTYAIVISTNKEENNEHQTYALCYTFNELFKSNYSNYWIKNGGYKENLILFPSKDIYVNFGEQSSKLFATTSSYAKYLNEYKSDPNNPIEKDEVYDPSYMYKRFYNFGTCVENGLNSNRWNCKWNDIDVNGFNIRTAGMLKHFGKVLTFDELINKIIIFIDDCRNIKGLSENLSEKVKQDTEINELKSKISELESKIKSFELSDLESKINSLKSDKSKLETKSKQLQEELFDKIGIIENIKHAYESKIKNLKISKDNEIKCKEMAFNRLKKDAKINEDKYSSKLVKLLDENKELKEELENVKTNVEDEINKVKSTYSHQFNKVQSASYTGATCAFILGVLLMLLINVIKSMI